MKDVTERAVVTLSCDPVIVLCEESVAQLKLVESHTVGAPMIPAIIVGCHLALILREGWVPHILTAKGNEMTTRSFLNQLIYSEGLGEVVIALMDHDMLLLLFDYYPHHLPPSVSDH